MSSRLLSLLGERSDFRSLGIVTAGELENLGRSSWWIEEAVRRGDLDRLTRGAFVAERGSTLEGRWLQQLGALVLSAGSGAVVAAASAAALHGLDGFDAHSELVVEVPVGRNPTRARRYGEVRRRVLESEERNVRQEPFVATSVARTLVGLGTGVRERLRWPGDRSPIRPDDLVELAVESALRRRLVTVAELDVLLNENARAGAGLRRVLRRRPPGAPPTESYLETRFVQLARAGGLPTPERQVTVHDRYGKRIGRIDFRLGGPGGPFVETDGRETHGATAFGRDRARWNSLQAAGHRLVVLTYDQVEREPEGTLALIRDVLNQVDISLGTGHRAG